MSKVLKVGIIGSGGIAGAHARAYLSFPNAKIIGVMDIIPDKAQSFIDDLEIKDATAFDDLSEFLKLDMEAVSVCTPNATHCEVTVEALKARKHVLVEKPLAVTLDEGIEMVKAAKKYDRMLTVGLQPRYDPNMKVVKEIIQNDTLGKVYYMQAGGGRRRGMPGGTFINKELAGAGAMADIGCYSLDLVLNALDYPKPLTVSAYTSNYFGTNPDYHPEAEDFQVEDFGVAIVRLEGGKVLNFKISWAMHMDTLGPTMFLGTNAGLSLTPAGEGPWSGVWDGGIGTMTLFHDEGDEQVETEIPIEKHDIDVFSEKIRDFVDAVIHNKAAPIPGEEILINQAIIDGILRSAELEKEVEIDIPEI